MEGFLTAVVMSSGDTISTTSLYHNDNAPAGARGKDGRVQFIVGSAPTCDLVINQPGWEPEHLRFAWSVANATWYLRNNSDAPLIIDNTAFERGETVPLLMWEAVLRSAGVALHFERHPSAPYFEGRPVVDVPLDSRGLHIGRGKVNRDGTATPRLCLDEDMAKISTSQAEIFKKGRDYFIRNLNTKSAEVRTLHNGVADYDEKKLVLGDCIQIPNCGYYSFKFNGDSLVHVGQAGVLQGTGLSVVVGGGRRILKDVSLDVHKGKFLGIIGGSGQGKSTLLNALCGIVPATSGQVTANGVVLQSPKDVARAGIGYVPQADIVHRELTVEDALYYAAKIRLRAPRSQIDDVIRATMELLELTEHRDKRIAQLSGGQQKRVSVASELLAYPNYLFLDEPTSGLDPQTEQALMGVLSELAVRRQMGVVCTTHVLQNANLMQRMAYISRGRVLFHGSPSDGSRFFLRSGRVTASDTARSSFGSATDSFLSSAGTASASASGDGVLKRQAEHDDTYFLEKIRLVYQRAQNLKLDPADQDAEAEEWESEYRQSSYFIPPVAAVNKAENKTSKQQGVGSISGLALLLSRQWKLLVSSKLNYLFLLMQAIVIGGMIAWVDDNPVLQLFLSVIATLWFGCSNGAQQIVGELAIFRRERLAGLGIHTYLLSKFVFLTLITVFQALLLFAMVTTLTHVFHPEKGDEIVERSKVSGNPDRDVNLMPYEIPDHRGYLCDKGTRDFREAFFDHQPWSLLSKGNDGLDEPGSVAKEPESSAASEPVAGAAKGGSERDPLGLIEELDKQPMVEGADAGVLDFDDPVDQPSAGATKTKAAPDPLTPVTIRINRSGLRVTDPEFIWLERLSWLFGLRKNVIHSLGVQKLDTTLNMKDSARDQWEGTKSWKLFVGYLVGLRVVALILAALVGVALGLAVSSLVNTPTQAVMWVPLILIPQILFGAFVVIIPEMSNGVLSFSRTLPSFNLQRIMDVSLIYGQEAPRMTNKTKIPAFLNPPPDDKESVKWDGGNEVQYDQIAQVNKAWQNLVVIREILGMRPKERAASGDGDKDTVENRADVSVTMSEVYGNLSPAHSSALVLGGWAASCYLVAAFSLYRRQTGR